MNPQDKITLVLGSTFTRVGPSGVAVGGSGGEREREREGGRERERDKGNSAAHIARLWL